VHLFKQRAGAQNRSAAPASVINKHLLPIPQHLPAAAAAAAATTLLILQCQLQSSLLL
jgi:hypothetical protein